MHKRNQWHLIGTTEPPFVSETTTYAINMNRRHLVDRTPKNKNTVIHQPPQKLLQGLNYSFFIYICDYTTRQGDRVKKCVCLCSFLLELVARWKVIEKQNTFWSITTDLLLKNYKNQNAKHSSQNTEVCSFHYGRWACKKSRRYY